MPALHNPPLRQEHIHPHHTLESTVGNMTPPLDYALDTDVDTDDTLTIGCDDPCDGCSGGCTTTTTKNNKNKKKGLIDIEDYEVELSKLRARTKELEEAMAKARVDDAVSAQVEARPRLRSTDWFNRKDDLAMSALYVERYLSMGLTREELMSDKPIIGIAQSGSDIAPVSFLLSLCLPFSRESLREEDLSTIRIH